MLSNKAIAIVDPDVRKVINGYQWNIDRVISPLVFVKQHRKWIENNTFKIEGMDRYQFAYITDGCTGAFNEVYGQNCYVLQGEYPYHRDSLQATVLENYLQIPRNSRLIISYPFAASGNPHQDWDEILDHCKNVNTQIFIDACLVGVSKGLITLQYPITHIAFSFSKAFGTGFARTGIVYTHDNTASPASITNKYLYIQHNNVQLHAMLMQNFSSDFIYKKYESAQSLICKEHNLAQSDCVLFGNNENGRLCITKLICNN